MWNFLSMIEMATREPYSQRKVERTENAELIVDTVSVTDWKPPFETAVCNREYNAGKWIVVEAYVTREQAIAGHMRWVKIMTSDSPPTVLNDVRIMQAGAPRELYAFPRTIDGAVERPLLPSGESSSDEDG